MASTFRHLIQDYNTEKNTFQMPQSNVGMKTLSLCHMAASIEALSFCGSFSFSSPVSPFLVHDDQSAQQDRDRGDVLDYRYMTLHVRLMPETRDSINEESLRFSVREHTSVTSPMRHPMMPKSATLINAARPDWVHGGRDA